MITFRLEGSRSALLRASRPGDLLLFVGTQTDETAPQERGRLLGLAEIGRSPIEAEDVIDRPLQRPAVFDESGRYRWPKALPMLRAWRFVEPPRVLEVLDAQLSYSATTGAVLLSPEDAEAVLALPRQEVTVPEIPSILAQRRLSDAVRAGRPTTGPVPTSWEGQTGRSVDAVCFTYALRFWRRDLWKIGIAADVSARISEVNAHVPSEVIGEAWKGALLQQWPDGQSAYAMEQRVLAFLQQHRTVGERVKCTQKQLEHAWFEALVSGDEPPATC